MFIRCLVPALVTLSMFPLFVLADDPPIDNETCLDCHEGMDTTLAGTPHYLAVGERHAMAVSCTDCHTGATEHLDEPDVSTIGNPAHYTMARSVTVCGSCHNNPHQLSMAEQNPHAVAGLNCASCHTIHAAATTFTKAALTEKCLGCHTEMRAEFELTSNHRVLEGVVGCVDCHDISQQLSAPFGDLLHRRCFSCHGELEGPYPYEHQATNAYGVEGGGCIECHQPHGSVFDRLLREPPTQLCRQCHAVPTHLSAHGGLFGNEDCLTCHTEIHGSFDNAQYFPMGVPPVTCQQSGCHPLGGN